MIFAFADRQISWSGSNVGSWSCAMLRGKRGAPAVTSGTVVSCIGNAWVCAVPFEVDAVLRGATNENGARINLLFTGARESESQLLLAIGLILVDFLRLVAIVALFAAGLALFSRDAAAQSLDSEIAGVFGGASESGYMGLGGGLSKAVGKHSKAKPATAARHPSHEPSLRAAAARYEPTPVFFVFQTLDHSGFNISRVGVRVPSNGF